jgi:hypothetical protein
MRRQKAAVLFVEHGAQAHLLHVVQADHLLGALPRRAQRARRRRGRGRGGARA